MNCQSLLFLFGLFLSIVPCFGAYEGPIYDHSAYTECKSVPEDALYNGGIMKDYRTIRNQVIQPKNNSYHFVLNDLSGDTIYSFSSWVQIVDADSAVIKAILETANGTVKCIGNVVARPGCWLFLKGGFVLDFPSSYAILYFQVLNCLFYNCLSGKNDIYRMLGQRSDGEMLNIAISSVSLQPFTYLQWRRNQQDMIDKERKCTTTIHVSDVQGERVTGASIIVEQVSRDFPLGSAITKTILGNPTYQARYLEMVLREGFSHPGVNGIMLWTALHPNGCYQMCLTDNYFNNLPAGDTVDNLLKEWQSGVVHGDTDEHGSFSFSGFLGEYKVTVKFGNRTANSTFSLYRGGETRHLNVRL